MFRAIPQTPQLPNPPTLGSDIPLSQGLRRWLDDNVVRFGRDLVNALTTDLTSVHDQLNTQSGLVGEDVPSASAIAVTAPVHRVTGNASIKTITSPPGFSGPLWLIAGGAWHLITGGNIAAAATATVNRTMVVVFDVRTNLWYPGS